jgi:hypothetical protein
MPRAEALWSVFQKRWAARFWQSQGIRVFVDLTVDPEFRDLNLLGVPKGWSAFATRWLERHADSVGEEYALACESAGDTTPLFVVIGGYVEAKKVCQERGWVWVKEHAGAVRDRYENKDGE